MRRRERDGSPEIAAAIVNWDDRQIRRSVMLSELGFTSAELARHARIHACERWSDSYASPRCGSVAAGGAAAARHSAVPAAARAAVPKDARAAAAACGAHPSPKRLAVCALARGRGSPSDKSSQLDLELGARRTGQLLLHLPSEYSLRDASADSQRASLQPEQVGGSALSSTSTTARMSGCASSA